MAPLTILSYGSLRLFKKKLYLRKELLKKKNKKGSKGNLNPPGVFILGPSGKSIS